MSKDVKNATLEKHQISVIVYVDGAPSCIIDNTQLGDNEWQHDLYIEHPSLARDLADALADAASAVRFADWKSARASYSAGDAPF